MSNKTKSNRTKKNKNKKCYLNNKNHPKLDLDKWNKNKYIQNSHNCYAYALNMIDPNNVNSCKKLMKKKLKCQKITPQPGMNYGFVDKSNPRNYTCKKVSRRMLGDSPKMEKLNKDEKVPDGYYKIALTHRSDGSDYHFYRQDSNGLWSHKSGWKPAKNVDESNKLITNPEKADRGTYDVFCGYYKVPIKEGKKNKGMKSSATMKHKIKK